MRLRRKHQHEVKEQPFAHQGPEWFKAQCLGNVPLGGEDDCELSWEGHGTLQSRHERDRAQKHANRTGHVIDAEHANAR